MELSDLKGVGPVRLTKLRAMGIRSLRDLLYHLPVRYEDHETEIPCANISQGAGMVRGVIVEKPKIAYFHGISRVTAIIRDESGSLSLCWFNEPWMVQQLPVGKVIRLYGRTALRNGKALMYNPSLVDRTGWMPVYKRPAGFPERSYQAMIKEALSVRGEILAETLPEAFLRRNRLCGLSEAILQAHFPDSLDALKAARRRLSFENMLMYLVWVAMIGRQRDAASPISGASLHAGDFWNTTPFPPTSAQRRVLQEIAADLEKSSAMARLVQGDVGCGKTILAFGAIFLAWQGGFQAAMMAPTEILAEQHYENAILQLGRMGIRCRLLTGSTRAKERRQILEELRNGSCDAVFGTHALISEGVKYARLGLAITDEQHRFGVRQRSRLQEKGSGRSKEGMTKLPHVLVMSATPIPRTMALLLYGDLDLSIVDELPPGRQAVKTRIVPENKREDMYHFLRRAVSQGHQAYLVCPLVEDSEALDEVASAKSMFETLRSGSLRELRLGLLWGNQKSEEKSETLRAFADGNLDVLVSTTVIEVGVNVPNATIMIIENAERFGLSQLHQLRGRVGRGKEESWCFLLSSAPDKLRILCETADGFEVARKDLEMRGPGDLMGTRQSGETINGFLPDGDVRLLDEVAESVRRLYAEEADPEEKIKIEETASSLFAERGMKIARN